MGIASFLRRDRAALETVLANSFIAALVFGTGIVLARALGPAGRGQVAAHLVAIGASFAVGSLGLNYGAAFASARSGGAQQAFSSILLFGGASLLATVILDLSIEVFAISGASLAEAGWSVAGAVTTQAASILLGWIQGSKAIRAWNALRILQLGGSLPLVLALWWLGSLTVASAVAAYALSQLAAVFAAILTVARQPARAPAALPPSAREIWSYSSSVAMSSALYQVNQRWDQLLLAFLRRTEDLGVYASAVSLAGVGSALVAGLAQATYAEGLHAEAGERRTLGRRRILTAVCVASLCAVFLTLLRKPLMRIVYGPSFERGSSALMVLAWGTVFLAGNYVTAELLRSAGNSRAPMWADLTAAAVTVLTLPLAILRFGILGAAAVSALAYALTFALNFRFARKLLRPFLRDR